jgi:hypothetical protein
MQAVVESGSNPDLDPAQDFFGMTKKNLLIKKRHTVLSSLNPHSGSSPTKISFQT